MKLFFFIFTFLVVLSWSHVILSIFCVFTSTGVGDSSVVGAVFLIFLAVELAVDSGTIILSIIY